MVYQKIISNFPVYKNYKGFSDKLSYNCPIIIYSVSPNPCEILGLPLE